MAEDEFTEEAEKVLRELSNALGDVDLEETYYVVDEINVTRPEGQAKKDPQLHESLRKNAPHMDDEGYYTMEIGKWVK